MEISLGQAQEEFSICLSELILWANSIEYKIRMGEVFRTKEQAELNAKKNIGIVNSVHRKKLAADLFLSIEGEVTWDANRYQVLGDYWKTLHELSRWGGDFPNRDAVHFSFEWKGVQ